jgi:hypothetical protein
MSDLNEREWLSPSVGEEWQTHEVSTGPVEESKVQDRFTPEKENGSATVGEVGQEVQAGGGPVSQSDLGNGAERGSEGSPNRHVEAGRKGARRIHQLIQEGKLYEQEHGLKRGRQRLRQLIEEGKLYEREHGLDTAEQRRPKRPRRMNGRQALLSLLQGLHRLARPSVRKELVRLIQVLESEEQAG